MQVNFIIDEAVICGKGANSIISMLHFFFLHYGVGEKTVHLHADNCVGQNKNNAMMQYLTWRVMTGKHVSITLSFLVTGHTKFGPDWCFGLAKKKIRRCTINCLADICEAVNSSSHTGVNIAQLCGQENGTVIVPMYDWTTYLDNTCKRLPQIQTYHHFNFSSEHVWKVRVKEFAHDSSIEFEIYDPKAHLSMESHPRQMKPAGISRERKGYLSKHIRQFVADEFKDLVAPNL